MQTKLVNFFVRKMVALMSIISKLKQFLSYTRTNQITNINFKNKIRHKGPEKIKYHGDIYLNLTIVPVMDSFRKLSIYLIIYISTYKSIYHLFSYFYRSTLHVIFQFYLYLKVYHRQLYYSTNNPIYPKQYLKNPPQ